MSKFKIAGLLALVVTIVVVAAINVRLAFQERGLSDLSLASIVALANVEIVDGNKMQICCVLGGSELCADWCNGLGCTALYSATSTKGKPKGLHGTCEVCGKKQTCSFD